MAKIYKKFMGNRKTAREAHLMVCDEFKVDVGEKSLRDCGEGKRLKNATQGFKAHK